MQRGATGWDVGTVRVTRERRTVQAHRGGLLIRGVISKCGVLYRGIWIAGSIVGTLKILCTVAGRSCCGESCSWGRREEIHGEGTPALQPSFHPNLLDPAPGICKPSGELRQVHPTVICKVLLLRFSWVGVRLVLFDPFHKDSCVSHSANWVLLTERRSVW